MGLIRPKPTDPPSHVDARELLLHRGYFPKDIIRVDTDCILWVNEMDRAQTAWLHATAEGSSIRTLLRVEAGFPAWPREAVGR